MISVGLLNSARHLRWTRPKRLSGRERCRRTGHRLCTTSKHGLVELRAGLQPGPASARLACNLIQLGPPAIGLEDR